MMQYLACHKRKNHPSIAVEICIHYKCARLREMAVKGIKSYVCLFKSKSQKLVEAHREANREN